MSVREKALAASFERKHAYECEVGRVVLKNIERAGQIVQTLLGVTGEVVYAPRTMLVEPDGVVVKLEAGLYVRVQTDGSGYEKKHYLVLLVANEAGWVDNPFIPEGELVPKKIKSMADLGDVLSDMQRQGE